MDAIAPSNIQESTESPDDGTEFVDCASGVESKNPFRQIPSTNASPLSPFFFKTKSTFVHGQKPPWGWDYVFAFKLPKILKAQNLTDVRQSSIKNNSEDHLLVDIDPDAVDDCHKQGDEKSARMIRSRVEILSRLKSAGFVFSQLLVPSDDVILVRISLPEKTMKEKAINLGLELKLLPKYGGGFLVFSIARQDCFINHQLSQPRKCYFSPAERALIILNVLQSKEHWGCDLNIERLIYEQDILQAFALHSEHEHQQLIHDTVWSRWWDPTWKPPHCAMKDYLGGKEFNHIYNSCNIISSYPNANYLLSKLAVFFSTHSSRFILFCIRQLLCTEIISYCSDFHTNIYYLQGRAQLNCGDYHTDHIRNCVSFMDNFLP